MKNDDRKSKWKTYVKITIGVGAGVFGFYAGYRIAQAVDGFYAGVMKLQDFAAQSAEGMEILKELGVADQYPPIAS